MASYIFAITLKIQEPLNMSYLHANLHFSVHYEIKMFLGMYRYFEAIFHMCMYLYLTRRLFFCFYYI